MRKYKAFTLVELIIVMMILVVLATISILSYRSLVDSFSMNEVSLTIAQDIRTTQRDAMMLERNPNERWLHGIGLDFTRFETHREYEVFKWCSSVDFFDDSNSSLINDVPNLQLGVPVSNARISSDTVSSCYREDSPIVNTCLSNATTQHLNRWLNYCVENGLDIYPHPVEGYNTCDIPPDQEAILDAQYQNERSSCIDSNVNARLVTETKSFGDYDNLHFILSGNVRYILFESVSGKAFFYDQFGILLNYYSVGINNDIRLNDSLDFFEIEFEPIRGVGLNTRIMRVRPVSGMILFDFAD